MSRLSEDIPEAGRVSPKGKIIQSEARDALLHILRIRAGAEHTAEIALDVTEKHGDAKIGEGLCHHLHRDRFARSRRAGNQSVAIRHCRKQINILCFALRDSEHSVHIHKGIPFAFFLIVTHTPTLSNRFLILFFK